MEKERVMVFIDGNNLMKSAQQFQSKFRIDYLKLKGFFSQHRNLRRIYFFDALPDKLDQFFDSKFKFLDMLRHQGYTVKTTPLKYKNFQQGKDAQKAVFSSPYQKGVDMTLACELFKMAKENAFDTAIIISGDNDFASAIAIVQDFGKNVEVASFKKALGYDLKQVANKLLTLDNYAHEFSLEQSNPNI